VQKRLSESSWCLKYGLHNPPLSRYIQRSSVLRVLVLYYYLKLKTAVLFFTFSLSMTGVISCATVEKVWWRQLSDFVYSTLRSLSQRVILGSSRSAFTTNVSSSRYIARSPYNNAITGKCKYNVSSVSELMMSFKFKNLFLQSLFSSLRFLRI